MIKLMNSPMMPQPGHYELVAITKELFVHILRDNGSVDSYVGYPQTAEFVQRISGVPVEVSRRQTVLTDGDRVLIVKLAYRPQDASTKGQPVNENDYEFYLMRYASYAL